MILASCSRISLGMRAVTNKVFNGLLTCLFLLTANHGLCVQDEPVDCQSGNDDHNFLFNERFCQNQDFSFQKQFELSGDRVGSFVYRVFNNPERVRNQAAGSAILIGLDYIGYGETVREGIDLVRENTRFSFGDCGKVQLRTNRITAETCITSNSSLEWSSSYDFDSVQLHFNWSI